MLVVPCSCSKAQLDESSWYCLADVRYLQGLDCCCSCIAQHIADLQRGNGCVLRC